MKKLILLLALGMLAACEAAPSAPKPESDNRSANFDSAERVPVDENIYVITGEVYGDPESMTRQVSPGGASLIGVNGFVSGSAFGPEVSGKGFVRVRVTQISPEPDFGGTSGDILILKTGDTKMAALVAGDTVTIKCRADYEAIAPVMDREKITDEHETWEFDFCRLATPDIGNE